MNPLLNSTLATQTTSIEDFHNIMMKVIMAQSILSVPEGHGVVFIQSDIILDLKQ